MSIWKEFVQDTGGLGSASRLNMIIGILIGSIVVLYLTFTNNLGGEIFGTYMLASGGIYGITKWRESAVEMQQIKSDSPNPEPVIVPPLGPTTTINVGKSDEDVKARDVSVKAEGDVTVASAKRRRR